LDVKVGLDSMIDLGLDQLEGLFDDVAYIPVIKREIYYYAPKILESAKMTMVKNIV
jgi:hypothetical protein